MELEKKLAGYQSFPLSDQFPGGGSFMTKLDRHREGDVTIERVYPAHNSLGMKL